MSLLNLTRLPEVAGKFYPQEPALALKMLQDCLNATREASINNPKLLVLPHAGWNHCMPVMASGLRTLHATKARFKRVVLIGPAHHLQFSGVATPVHSKWKTLFGDMMVDVAGVNKLIANKHVKINNAAFTNEHALEVIVPALQAVLGEVKLIPLLVGDASHESLVTLLESIWGGAETLIVVSSDLSHFENSEIALAKDTQTRATIETFHALTGEQACGHRALNAALEIAARQDLRLTALDVRHSGQMTGEMNRVVGYGAFVGENAASARLAQQDRQHLIDTAFAAIKKASELNAMPHFTLDPLLKPCFASMRASFVSVKQNGKLRGCVGSLKPHQSLLIDVAENAVKAAYEDPRFTALTPQEVETLEIEVAILSNPRLMQAKNENDLLLQLRPQSEGLIIQEGEHIALFLPCVWETMRDSQDFVQSLKEKAGLPRDYWSNTMRFYRFTTESFAAKATEMALKAAA